MKKLFLSTFLLVLPLLASAYDIKVVNADGVTIYYNYINNRTELEVVNAGYRYSGEVNIPDKVTYNGNTLPVTSIGENAFEQCRGLTSVTIPNSVTTIGGSAFYDCSGLTSVTIGNSVTSIGGYAFYDCSGLTSVIIPNSVTSIGGYAFRDCSGLTSVTIGNSVTSIGGYAFEYCRGLTSVTIPNSVTSIGGYAFFCCSGLTSLNVESGNTVYDSRNNCNAIIETATNTLIQGCKTTDIPNSVTTIGGSAFSGCSGLTSVIIPNSVTTIGGYAFSGCSGLTSVTIGNSVTSIGGSAFENCSGLTSVIIPNSVTSIGESTFGGCSGLTSVTIGNSVTSIGSSAFYNCYRLNTIYCLNPIPPTCYDRTFWCNEVVRDRYDVYTYANLHVPMGSKEIYSGAHEWRYFEKIKEDMLQDGNIYYANLTVQQGTTGYTRQAIKAGETYTIYIGSFGDNRVNAVTFNGVDVTEEIVNGNYTTPEITGESVLCISYEMPSSVPSLKLNDVKVMGYDGEITISNIDAPSDISIYSVDGKTVDNIPSALGSARISVTPNQLYMVKVGNRTYKIAL